MNRVSTAIGVALAFAAVSSASIAQTPSPAAIGVAFQTEKNQLTVMEVLPGGSGDLMGVRPGDVITHAGGRKMTFPSRLTAFIRTLKVGDPVELTVTRKGKSLQLKGTAMARRR